MYKTVFICPLYDMRNHFDFAIDLLRSKRDLEITEEIYFIFTTEAHRKKFADRAENELGLNAINYLMLPAELDKYSSKAVTKKLFGLKQLMNSYDYVILIDSESKFVKKCDFGELASEIWNKRSMLASNISPDGFFVMRSFYLTMGLYNNAKLRKETENYKYNFWFNELQVYNCSYLPGFFAWLDLFDKNKILNEWCCFEYYLFFAYLCLEHNYNLLKYKYVSRGG